MIHSITKRDGRANASSLEADQNKIANIDGNTAMGSMLQIRLQRPTNVSAATAPEHAKAYREGDIHIHDFDLYSLTTTCTQIDILRLFHDGFSTGHGFLREPQSIQLRRPGLPSPFSPTRTISTAARAFPTLTTAWPRGAAKTFKRIYRQNLARP